MSAEMTRRQLFKDALEKTRGAALLTVATSFVAGCARITSPSPQDRTIKVENRGVQIRRQIREFEAAHPNEITQENLQVLFNLTKDLYQVTFGKPSLPSFLQVLPQKKLEAKDMPQEATVAKIRAPLGDSSVIAVDPQKPNVPQIPVSIDLGDETLSDPSINKLSVFRALIMHEYVHTQTQVVFNTPRVTIGGEQFSAVYKRGLKLVGVNGTHKEQGHFHEELHVQLIAEFLNDPTGTDDIWQRMKESPIYRHSLSPSYQFGLAILRKIYTKLCISITDVEEYHNKSQLEEFLAMMDAVVQRDRFVLPKPASLVLLHAETVDDYSDQGLEPLKDLALQLKAA